MADAPDPVRHDDTTTPDRRNPDWPRWFVVTGAVLGLVYVFVMPVSRPLDEPAHLRRVATLDRGVVIPPGFGETDPRYRVDGCLEAVITRATDNFRALIDATPQDLTTGQRWRMHTANPACGPDLVLRGGGTISNAEVNSPVPYVPAMIGYALGRPVGGALGSVYGARLAQLAAYLAICWWALRRLPWGRPFATTIALVPTALGGASGVSADPLTLALTLAVVATTLGVIDGSEQRPPLPRSGRTLAVLTILFVLLGLCKPAAAPLVLLALLVPAAAFATTRGRVAWTGATVGAVAVTGGAWAMGVSSAVHVTIAPNVDSAVTAEWLNRHLWTLPGTLRRTLAIPEATGYILGGSVVPLGIDVLTIPAWATLGGIALVTIARLCDPLPGGLARFGRPATIRRNRPTRRRLRHERIVATGIAVAGLVAVVYGVYIAANPPDSSVITGIQGRYFLPYLLLLLVGIRPTRAGSATPAIQRAVAIALVATNVAWLLRLVVWWRLV